MKIACLQTVIPHYREEFFKGIKKYYDINIYLYNENAGENFQQASFPTRHIKTRKLGKLLLFDFKKLIKDGNQCVIFPFQAKTLPACLYLLLLSKIYGFKVILWGHGISVHRYQKEELLPNPLLKLQLKYADGCWLYMDKERKQWSDIFPNKPIVALQNTISNADDIMNRQRGDKEVLKRKYGINEDKVVIYCARCTKERRFDLFVETIERLKEESVGFIIIGGGDCKPDFSSYTHVYDYGAVYDKVLKDDLFDMADVYYQPGWVGLSIVEAMLYGKPVLTFKRSGDVLQCVEYSNIEEGVNGHIVETVNEACLWLKSLDRKRMEGLTDSTKKFAMHNLSMKKMVDNAVSIINGLGK